MKALLVALALVASCKSGPAPKPIINGVIDCAFDSIESNAREIAGAVNRILVGNAEDWRDELSRLARSAGAEALACAVEAFRREVMSSPAASKDPELFRAAERGSVFLSEMGARFVQ